MIQLSFLTRIVFVKNLEMTVLNLYPKLHEDHNLVREPRSKFHDLFVWSRFTNKLGATECYFVFSHKSTLRTPNLDLLHLIWVQSNKSDLA